MKYRLRKVLAVFLAAAVSAGIFAAAAGTGSVHAEGSETNKGWSSVSPRVNQTYTVSLELGAEVFYGNYQTHYYTVDGRTAYCLEPLKAWLASGEYTAERLGTGNLRKGLYYVYGGPGYETFVKQHGYLGFSGKMVKDDEYCMSHCIVSYLYSGEDTAFTGLSGEQASLLKQKAGKICSMPEPPGYFNAFLFNKGGKGQVMGGTGKDLTGAVEIYKQSGRPDWTDGNSCYSLEGAEFGLFEPGADTPAYRVVTDANGYGRADNVRTGAYDVKEIKSPKGYTLDQTSHRITVEEASVCRYSCEDEARYYPAELILQKIDADTGESRAQGSASLSDAWFTVRFYPGYYDTDPAEAGIKAARTWVLKSDEKGRVLFSGNARVSGDDFFRNSDGENILPLGTVTIQETKAPRGYLLNNQVILSRVTESGAGATDTLFQIPEVEEQVIRGHIQLVKFREDINPEEDRKTPLEGIRFAITSKTTG